MVVERIRKGGIVYVTDYLCCAATGQNGVVDNAKERHVKYPNTCQQHALYTRGATIGCGARQTSNSASTIAQKKRETQLHGERITTPCRDYTAHPRGKGGRFIRTQQFLLVWFTELPHGLENENARHPNAFTRTPSCSIFSFAAHLQHHVYIYLHTTQVRIETTDVHVQPVVGVLGQAPLFVRHAQHEVDATVDLVLHARNPSQPSVKVRRQQATRPCANKLNFSAFQTTNTEERGINTGGDTAHTELARPRPQHPPASFQTKIVSR